MTELKNKANKYFSMFLTVLIFIVCIYLISQKFEIFLRILVALIGFGVVVLVHEFGHFIVAKLTDIHVEAFSIGFPPMLAGILRTEDGYRIRILPNFFKKEKLEEEKNEHEEKEEESQEQVTDEDGLCFNLGGGNGKAGETEYQIGLVPFGGFVKMLGQEDIGSVKSSDDPRSYSNKSVGIRMGVIAAGVLFNVLSAVIIFVTVFLIGIKQSPPVIGYVLPGSPAARAGLKAGDEVIEIGGKNRNLTFKDITMAAALSGRDAKVALKVRHEDGSLEDCEVTAKEEQTELGEMKLFGVFGAETLKVKKLKKASAKLLYERTGLKSGDVIKSVGGKEVRANWEIADAVQDALTPEVTLTAERDGGKKLIETKIPLSLSFTDISEPNSELQLPHICSMVPRLRIAGVENITVSFKEKLVSFLKPGTDKKVTDELSQLRIGDIIVGLGGIDNPTYKEIRDITRDNANKELSIRVLRVNTDGIKENLIYTVVPRQEKGSDRVMLGVGIESDIEHAVVAKTIDTAVMAEPLAIPRGAEITLVNGEEVADFYDVIDAIRKNAGNDIEIVWRGDKETLGVATLAWADMDSLITVKSRFAEIIPYEPLERLYKANGPIEAIAMGYQTTISFIANAYVTLQRFLSGVVSPKGFMGPVGLITVSYEIISKKPFIYYVYFIGLINAFIAVFNFLPLLPFDGGHFVFLLIEKVKGSAVSEKIQSAAIYAGWVLVGGFALYVTFNDIVRSFFS